MTERISTSLAAVIGAVLRIGLLAILGGSASPGSAAADDPAELCRDAARAAAARTGVPLAVLEAISLTETGRGSGAAARPWAWTVNMEGAGQWFDNLDGALSFAASGYQRGARSFDVGCFQLNYRWHGQNFASIEAMFEPRANALYAAEFLARLYRELGDWSAAAGAYHSRTEEYASRYRARFDRYHAEVLARGEDAPARTAPPQASRATLGLIVPVSSENRGRGGHLGSLVPLGLGG